MTNQLQSIFALPTLYFEIGGGFLLLALILWFVLARIRRGAAAKPLRDVTPTPSALPVKRDLRSLLTKTQEALSAKLDALILSTKQIDDKFIEGLEELLYTSDLGPKTVEKLLTGV